MNRDQIKRILQDGHRASLPAERKAVLRERLVEQMSKEAHLMPQESTSAQQTKKHVRYFRPRPQYLYPAAGIIAAAGIAGVVAVTFGIGSTGQSSSTSASGTLGASSSSSNASVGNTSGANASSNGASSTSASSNASATSGSTASHASVANSSSTNGLMSPSSSVNGPVSPATRVETNHQSANASHSASTASTKQSATNGPVKSNAGAKAQPNTQASDSSKSSESTSSTAKASATVGGTAQSNAAMHSNALPQTQNTLDLQNVHMTSAANGWATSANGAVLHTSSGGGSWIDVSPPAVLSAESTHGSSTIEATDFHTDGIAALSIRPTGSNHVTMYVTSNSGQSWHADTVGLPTGGLVTTMQMVSAQVGFAVLTSPSPLPNANRFTLYRTSDGGVNWTKMASDQHGLPASTNGVIGNSVHFTTSSDGWRLAEISNQQVVEQTLDGGKTWTRWTPAMVIPSSLQHLTAVSVGMPKQVGHLGAWMVTYQKPNSTSFFTEIYRTNDAGSTWSPGQPIAMQHVHLGGVSSSGFVAWAVDARKGLLYLSNDTGATWQSISLPTSIRNASTFDFVDAEHGFAVVSDANGSTHFYTTTDGGKTWGAKKMTLQSAH